MSAAILTSNRRLPEIYASTGISSPGFAITEQLPEPTGTRLAWEEDLPVWQQRSFALQRQQSVNPSPAAVFITRTGTGPIVVILPITVLIQKPSRVESAEPTVSVSRLIAQVRSSLSLQIKQLAEVLGVERPSVYAWIKEESQPRAHKRARLKELYQLARRWDELSNEPLGKALTEVTPDGYSALDFLLQSEIPHALMIERFKAIARARAHNQAAIPKRKSLSQIAQEIGIDVTRVKDRDDQIDLVTGKRVALE
jgi:transcriptional regulator with XRE-family HTH domain